MKIKLGAVLLGLFAAPVFASPYISVFPSQLAQYGAPGATVGWGFTIHSDDTDYLDVSTIQIVEAGYGPPAFGVWTAFLPNTIWPDASGFLIPPSYGDFTVAFDGISQGLGEYVIDPTTPVGSTETIEFDVTYNLWSPANNPTTCVVCGPADFTGTLTDQFLNPLQGSITATPEPATVSTMGIAAAMLAFAAWRRRKSSSMRHRVDEII